MDKVCPDCGVARPADEFYRRGNGLSPYCRRHTIRRSRQWNTEHLDRVHEIQSIYHARHRETITKKRRERYETRKNHGPE